MLLYDDRIMATDAKLLLKSAELFSLCTENDLSIVVSRSEFLHLSDGETIFVENDAPERLYLVVRGEVVVRKKDHEGYSVDIARFLTGDCLGELDMFTGENRNASAFALGEATLLAFPARDREFDYIRQEHPGVVARLMNTLLIQTSARIRSVNKLVKENSPLMQDLKKQVYLDKLTGLYNKTFFDETLLQVLSTAEGTTGLLMYKPDNFKVINDHYGHDGGDRVLRHIADGLQEIVPNRDMLFRYMGNENAVILPGAHRDDLEEMADTIGDYLRSIDCESIVGQSAPRLSVSFGLGIAPEHGKTAVELVNAVHPLSLEGRRRGGNFILYPEDRKES